MALTAQEIEALMPDCTELLSDEPEMESSLHYTPIKFSKYERLGLFRSTPEQEAVYLAQKIRHIQSGDAVPKSALLPRV